MLCNIWCFEHVGNRRLLNLHVMQLSRSRSPIVGKHSSYDHSNTRGDACTFSALGSFERVLV